MQRHTACFFAPLLLIVGILLLHIPAAHAVLILKDEFIVGSGDYVVDNLNTQSSASSTGFTSSWSGAGTGWVKIAATNLNMAGISNGGGSLLLTPNSDGHYSRSKTRSYTAAGTGLNQLWFSTLYMPSTNAFDPGRESMVGFLSGVPSVTGAGDGLIPGTVSHATDATWRTGNGTAFAGFGLGIDTMVDSSAYLSIKYQQDHGGTASVVSTKTSIALTPNTTYLLLARLDINTSGTGDVLNVWAVTSLPTSEEALGAPMWSISANLLTNSSNLNTLALWAGTLDDRVAAGGLGQTAALSYYDALRVGTTFYDVAPEPSRALLLMIAFITTLIRRRRSA